MGNKTALLVMLIVLSMVFSSITVSYSQMQGNKTCEACGMTVMSDAQMQFKIRDSNGTMHNAECLMCAFKLLKTFDQLNITTFCDWYGPNSTITINAKDHGETVTINDTSALFMNAGGCTKTRVAFNQTAVDALLANGYSNYTSSMLRTILPSNTTIMTISQAAKLYGGGIPEVSPSPSQSPSPTQTMSPTPTSSPIPSPSYSPTPTITPNPTITASPIATSSPVVSPKETQQPEISPSPTQNPNSPTTTPVIPTASPSPISITTQTCEACGMEVNPVAQEKYVITDGSGNIHYAECFMCALNLIKNYDQLHIVTSCDWYGPNCTISVDSSQFGKVVTVSPSTAIFLNGGSCVINRAAYNQTAANELLTNGFSQYTLPNQQYALPSSTTIATVKDAAIRFSQNSPAQVGPASTSILILVAAIGIVVIALSIVAFRKLKK